MKTRQERLLKEVSGLSFAAPFVFFPDLARGKRSPRQVQPADLVWACNNCVILMYMTESKSSPTKTVEQHNLPQAKNWMRKWKRGSLLVGKNEWHAFAIKHTPGLN